MPANRFVNLPGCSLSRHAVPLIIGALLTVVGFNATAADVTVQPTAGSSFVVKDSTATKDLLHVAADQFVGIGTTTPHNYLQIGDAVGFYGYDIAFGNGTQSSGLWQMSDHAAWYSKTDITLMPLRYVGGVLAGPGRVGINTTTPGAALEVDGSVNITPTYGYVYYARKNDPTMWPMTNYGPCNGCSADVSILASNRIAATEFNAFSDIRIKDVVGTSDSADDLKTINALQVTNYTLKDKVRNGNRPFKKVIAQQVENIYPQVVSHHVDFIPNVYQAASKIEKTETGYLLRFDSPHNLTAQAKRVKLLASGDNTMQKTIVISIPSDSSVIVDLPTVNGDKVFVYGEEVDDFRTVDYEGLTALNISATQELSKRITQQKADIPSIVAEKDAQLAGLRTQLAEQKMRVVQLESFADDMAQVKMELAALKRNSGATQTLDVALQK